MMLVLDCCRSLWVFHTAAGEQERRVGEASEMRRLRSIAKVEWYAVAQRVYQLLESVLVFVEVLKSCHKLILRPFGLIDA
jgi:hypothetical protein